MFNKLAAIWAPLVQKNVPMLTFLGKLMAVINWGSDWRKDVVNQCLEFALLPLPSSMRLLELPRWWGLAGCRGDAMLEASVASSPSNRLTSRVYACHSQHQHQITSQQELLGFHCSAKLRRFNRSSFFHCFFVVVVFFSFFYFCWCCCCCCYVFVVVVVLEGGGL